MANAPMAMISEHTPQAVDVLADPPGGDFIGADPEVRRLLDLIGRVAAIDATVLISGETGTGKELIARRIHRRSSRRRKAMHTVNCAAAPTSLQESAFFGHERGAFTGANLRQEGWFAAADGGTLFLDEIQLMNPSMQGMLLRILQTGEYAPVGSTRIRTCDVRVIAASNADLLELVDSGVFRRDLFYRLDIVSVTIPPLRQRRGDIPPLVQHFLHRHADRFGMRERSIDDQALDSLQGYAFPGNVRELENLVQQALILGGGHIRLRHLPTRIRQPTVRRSTPAPMPDGFHDAKAQVIEAFERDFLERSLQASQGIVARAAQLSGLSERNFHAKLKRYGIDYGAFRNPTD